MVRFFVRKRAAVFCFCILILVMGLMAYFSLPRESMPEIKQPYIFVTTTYPGVAAADMENLVTRPIESEIDGLEGINEITSSSMQSLSSIFIKFNSDISVETALRRVRERVDVAKGELPVDVNEPNVTELSSSSWPILIVVLSHPDGLSLLDKDADKVEEALKRIHGVLDVKTAGKLQKELAIEVDPEKLENYGFSINNVIQAVQSEIANIPGGNLHSPSKNYTLAVTGEIRDPAFFEDIVIKEKGVKMRLGEVATARFTWAEPETYSRFNGQPCVSLNLSKRSGENIIDIVNDAKKILGEMKPELPAGTIIDYSYDESQNIREMVADLENNIITAFILVMGVTIFFLGFRNAIFVSLAIPFSMLMSFFILQIMGITLNMIVLFSLVIALGMLVDNGIVIVENIFRHAAFEENRAKAAISGSQEVALPILTSTLTTCLAFFPIMFMPDVIGDMMSYLPKTVIVVLTCSLIVAVTINPVFCASFLNVTEKNRKQILEGSGTFVRFQNWYGDQVKWAVKRKWRVLAFSFGVCVLGFLMYGKFGKEPIFFPNLDPSTSVIAIEAPQGTPLDSTDKIVRGIETIVPQAPASMKNFKASTGRGASDNRFGGGGQEYHKANVRVEYKPFLERDIKGSVAADSLKTYLKNVTGAEVKVKEINFGPPTGNPVSYKVTGYDYAILGAIADSILEVLKRYPELKLVESDFEAALPEIAVDVDREKAAYYGLSTREVASSIRNTINGATVGKFRENEDEYDIKVRFQKTFRNSINNLKNLQIVNKDGNRIPLRSVAAVRPRSSVGVIRRTDLNRAVEVWADFRENTQNKMKITAAIEKEVHKIPLPEGYRIGPGGGFQMREDATEYLKKAFVIAVFLILIVLIAQFNSVFVPIIIISAVVLSIGGVLWGYLLTGREFVIVMSGIGCIALAGVVVNNCIVLIDYTNILIRKGIDWKDAIVDAGKTRLRPVLLTAITTVLGMLPMALGFSIDFHNFTIQLGSESGQFWIAFAWAMIFGLSFATVMTLIVVPCFLAILYRFSPPKIEEV